MTRRARKPRRVLVIEDNLDAVRTLTLLLREAGHEVEFAINGYAGVDSALRFRPQFVLLDLGLPGLDGYEVCTLIRREPEISRAYVVAVTGHASEEHRARSHAAGCDLHLLKPVSPVALCDLLDSPLAPA